MSYAIFNEGTYLANNPDVRNAVAAGAFASGLQHFQQSGIREGRTGVSQLWDEQRYFAANPDVRAAVNARAFSSGLQHYILFGETERRQGGPVVDTTPGFNENYYYGLYPDLGRANAAGQIASGISHYNRFGRFEGRTAFFSGSSGSDIVTGIGPGGSAIVGISVDINATVPGAPSPVPRSLGVGEADILIGGQGPDRFGLGFGLIGSNTVLQRFYVGQGSNDYAYIVDFESEKDLIQLAGSPNEYSLTVGAPAGIPGSVGGVNIFTNTGDLVAFVEGVSSLRLAEQNSNAGIFAYT